MYGGQKVQHTIYSFKIYITFHTYTYTRRVFKEVKHFPIVVIITNPMGPIFPHWVPEMTNMSWEEKVRGAKSLSDRVTKRININCTLILSWASALSSGETGSLSSLSRYGRSISALIRQSVVSTRGFSEMTKALRVFDTSPRHCRAFSSTIALPLMGRDRNRYGICNVGCVILFSVSLNWWWEPELWLLYVL